MRYMYEVVKLSQKNPNINWKEVRKNKLIFLLGILNLVFVSIFYHLNIYVIICNFKGLGSRRYLKKEINEVRELWAEYFTVECL